MMERIKAQNSGFSFLSFFFLLGTVGYLHMFDNYLILQLRKSRLKSAEDNQIQSKIKQNTS